MDKDKKTLCSQFKVKHAKVLKDLIERANKYEILFCANWWTGAGTSIPMFMSFDFDEVFDIAYKNGITNPNPSLTRIEYWEVGKLYPWLTKIGHIGLDRV